MATGNTPRVLRISFQIHIPRGVVANIRQVTLDRAFDTLSGAVRALAPSVLPWASHITVRKEWLYDWTDATDTYQLPPTEKNTPTSVDDTSAEKVDDEESAAA